MQFTLDGESFELTPALVRGRLAGHLPEEIRMYWVEIDGARWPVKQVISLATGAKRGRFQSQQSRRWPQSLGFPIGSGPPGAVNGPPPRLNRTSDRGSFDESRLRKVETLDVRVAFSWLRAGPVTLDEAGLPRFPPLPRAPGLYRYDFGRGDDGIRVLYIGESVELSRRARNYRNATTDRSSQRTSRRIHKEITGHVASGGSIECSIATSVRWGDGVGLDLRLKSARRLAENAAVLLAQSQSGIRVLNIDTELGGESG
ncbi:hypothetical protein [Streptomyces sp. Cmuel-A718b]|uniref:hypothetical protein n=1 Tax=Streptomyces sp. Cmuel-A718b TaxID=697328 RepID=UPI00081F1D4E|nr:hypothetical protein [Streptomyces sp. Cmuel-A718b]SCF80371.1 hypothetical protein GA0115280_113221 [Streptomyces sp. Cmuel-A718b]